MQRRIGIALLTSMLSLGYVVATHVVAALQYKKDREQVEKDKEKEDGDQK